MPAKAGIQVRSAFEIRLQRMTDQGKSLSVQEKSYSALDLESTPIAKPRPGLAKQALIDFGLRAGSIFTLVLISSALPSAFSWEP
jgi:hypothetical protein